MNDGLNVLTGWMIDGSGEPARRQVLIQVENGRIEALRRYRADDLTETGRPLLDLSHCTVLPGLVDCHVHLTMAGRNDTELRQWQLHLAFEQAAPAISDHILKQLAHGVLGVRDGGDAAGHTLRYQREVLPLEGLPIVLKTTGAAWRARGRYGRLIGQPPEEGLTLAQSIERQPTAGEHIKIIQSGLNSLTTFGKQTPAQFSLDDLKTAVRTAHRRNLKVMVHANGEVPVRTALEAGCDSIEHGFFMGRGNMERMAALRIAWAPTAFSMQAYREQLPPGSPETEMALRNLEHQLEQIAQARHLGVPVVVGTDSGGLGIRHGKAFSRELSLLMEAGFSLEEAVRCACRNGAKLLGVQNELGQLRVGMPATFVAVAGPPSSLPGSLSPPEGVYIRGRRQPMPGNN